MPTSSKTMEGARRINIADATFLRDVSCCDDVAFVDQTEVKSLLERSRLEFLRTKLVKTLSCLLC